jgi:hypothetical protein
MTTSIPTKPFSMIREFQLADRFTLANDITRTDLKVDLNGDADARDRK